MRPDQPTRCLFDNPSPVHVPPSIFRQIDRIFQDLEAPIESGKIMYLLPENPVIRLVSEFSEKEKSFILQSLALKTKGT
jgi:hypothetical protein